MQYAWETRVGFVVHARGLPRLDHRSGRWVPTYLLVGCGFYLPSFGGSIRQRSSRHVRRRTMEFSLKEPNCLTYLEGAPPLNLVAGGRLPGELLVKVCDRATLVVVPAGRGGRKGVHVPVGRTAMRERSYVVSTGNGRAR